MSPEWLNGCLHSKARCHSAYQSIHNLRPSRLDATGPSVRAHVGVPIAGALAGAKGLREMTETAKSNGAVEGGISIGGGGKPRTHTHTD